MDRLIWCLSFASAALAGAVVAVWVVSYLVEERFSVRRVRGTAERPEETTLELYWSRGGVCVYYMTRVGDDDCFVPDARPHLDRGWFFDWPAYSQRPCFDYAGGLDRYPLLGFSGRRSRSQPDGPIEWRRASVVVPCWFLVLTFVLLALVGWHRQRIGGGPVALTAAGGFVLAIVPLGLSAWRGLRMSNEVFRRWRQHNIEKALCEGRVEMGMMMAQVTQVLTGWTGRRIHYSIGGRDEWEMWEFRRDDAANCPETEDKPVGVFFRNGEVVVSTYKRNAPETA